jgi:hypothetical protein
MRIAAWHGGVSGRPTGGRLTKQRWWGRLPGDVVGEVRDGDGLVLFEQATEGSGTGADRGSEADGLGSVWIPGLHVQLDVCGIEGGDTGAQSSIEDGQGGECGGVSWSKDSEPLFLHGSGRSPAHGSRPSPFTHP